MAPRIVVVPGTNTVLAQLVRRLEGDPNVAVLESANAALWQIRHAPPQILVADTQLKDMAGGDLVDIVAALNPGVRVILSGAGSAELGRAVQAAGGQLLEHDKPPERLVQQLSQILGVTPARRTESSSQPALRPTAPGPAAEGGRPAAPVAQPWMPRGGSQVIQPRQMSVVQTLLGTLAGEVGAECVLLSDTVGMRLFEVGTVPSALGPAIEPLLSTAFSTADQLARLLKEQEARSLFLHEGTRYDIYAFNVGQRFILTLIFDKNINAGTLGSVWVYAKRAARQLQITLEQ